MNQYSFIYILLVQIEKNATKGKQYNVILNF